MLVTRTSWRPISARAWPRAVILAVIVGLASPGAAWAERGARSLRGAMEAAVSLLLSDLFTERAVGTVMSVEPAGDLTVRFPATPPPADAEYLVVRPPKDAEHGFAETVGLARIVEARGQTALARVVWSHGRPAAGDSLVWPSRITVILARTDPGDRADLAESARRLDHWLELELVGDRRVRVLRADTPAAEDGRAERLRGEREYGLVVAPLLLSTPDGIEVVLRVRSAFTRQTLAQRRGVWASAPPLPAPPPAPAAVPAAPAPLYGKGIQPAERPGGLTSAQPTPGYAKAALPHAVNAIALADVDGDGRAELAAITDDRVVLYRWTGRDVETLALGDRLPVFTTFIYVDAGDLDGDGRDEIAVTAVRTVPRGNRLENAVESTVLRWSDGRLKPAGPPLDRHVRILRRPGQPAVLLTQKLGAYEPVDGEVETLEWRDQRPRPAGRLEVSLAGIPLHGLAVGDLDGDGQVDLAAVGPDRRLRIYDGRGRPRWESDEDLGDVGALGFAQTPRFPDYRGLGFDATAEQLSVWRVIARRVLVSASAAGPEVLTLASAGPGPGGSSPHRAASHGRVVGYGWDAERRTFTKRWESSPLAGGALDVAVGDVDGDRRSDLVTLSGSPNRRWVETFELYTR